MTKDQINLTKLVQWFKLFKSIYLLRKLNKLNNTFIFYNIHFELLTIITSLLVVLNNTHIHIR